VEPGLLEWNLGRGANAPPLLSGFKVSVKLAKTILGKTMGSSRAVQSNPYQGLWIVDHCVGICDNTMEANVFSHIFFPVFVV
jgi:hypothetical protein